MKRSFILTRVSSKIALLTSGALFFVTGLFLLFFLFLDVNLLSKFTFIQLLTSFVLLLVFVEVLLVVLSTNVLINRPLDKIKNVVRQAEDGNFLTRVDHVSTDELGELSQSFNRMLAKITDLDARKIETEHELALTRHNLAIKNELEAKTKIIEETNSKLEHSLKELSVLYSVSQVLSQSLTLNELILAITHVMKETLKLKESGILFLDDNKEYLEVRQFQGVGEVPHALQGVKFRLGEGVSGRAALEKRTIYIEDRRNEENYLHYKTNKQDEGSFVSVPLMVRDEVIGVLNVGDPQTKAFTETDIKLFRSLANQIGMAYDRAMLYMKTRELSVKDELTGLYNRRYFQNMLEMEWKKASRFSRPLSLLMIDVDFFKQYNDSYGHLSGDAVLQYIAEVLESNVREVDTVARFGGEEFVILLEDTNFENSLHVAENLKDLVQNNSAFFLKQRGQNKNLTISIGVSSFPERATTEEELLLFADRALYRAKGLGRNRVCGYDPDTVTKTEETFERSGPSRRFSA
ncbi:diguanylate cyclase [bacterium]|nr:diguanylate cyclase [bacterium]